MCAAKTPPSHLACLPQAALHAAAEAGLDTGGDEHRWEGPGAPDALAADQVHDPASSLFWRNVRARVSKGGTQHRRSSKEARVDAPPALPLTSVCHPVHLQASVQSQASAAHAMRRFARRECPADLDASLETSLHPPLTLPRQPRQQPAIMEQPAPKQPGVLPAAAAQPAALPGSPGAAAAVKAEPESPERQAAATPAAATQLPVAAKAEPLAPLPSLQQSMDLYGDLDLQARGSVPSAAAAAAQRQQIDGGAVGRQHQHAAPPAAVQAQPTAQQAAPFAAAAQPDAAGDLKALLSNPAALQALLKDHAQLQRLLEKHPALISILKNTLGQK